MTTPDPLRAALEEATNWIDTAASNDVPEAYKLVDQLHLALAADTAPPTTPDTLRAALEEAYDLLAQMDKQALNPGYDHLVKVTVEAWRDGIRPVIARIRAALEAKGPRP